MLQKRDRENERKREWQTARVRERNWERERELVWVEAWEERKREQKSYKTLWMREEVKCREDELARTRQEDKDAKKKNII